MNCELLLSPSPSVSLLWQAKTFFNTSICSFRGQETCLKFLSFQHSWQAKQFVRGDIWHSHVRRRVLDTVQQVSSDPSDVAQHSAVQERRRSLHSWCAWDPGEGEGQLQKSESTVWDPAEVAEPHEKAQKGCIYYCFCNYKCCLVGEPLSTPSPSELEMNSSSHD